MNGLGPIFLAMRTNMLSGQHINVTARLFLPVLLRNSLAFGIIYIILSHISLVHGILPPGMDLTRDIFEDAIVSPYHQQLSHSNHPLKSGNLWLHEELAKTNGFEHYTARLLRSDPLQGPEVSQQASSDGAKSGEGVSLSFSRIFTNKRTPVDGRDPSMIWFEKISQGRYIHTQLASNLVLCHRA